MKTIGTAAVSAALIVFCVSIGQAASKPNDVSQAIQARSTLEQIDSLSASMVDATEWLARTARDSEFSESRVDRLNTLRDDVNQIGHDLQVLEAERGSLTEWESKTVDEVVPLMRLITAYTTGEIETYTANRHDLWATSFPGYAARIFEDAGKVKELLDGGLKLATAREKEQRRESEVESTR